MTLGRARLAVSGSVSKLSVGRADALFCERTQRLSALNETASCIWTAIQTSGSYERAAASLVDLGASPEDAQAYVLAAVNDWLRLGYLFPANLGRDGAARAVQAYRAGPLTFEIRFFGDADPNAGRTVFGGLPAAAAPPAVRLDVVGEGGSEFLFFGGDGLGMYPPSETPAVLKAHITDLCCNAPTSGFLTHGALISANGKRVLLAGEPGAGKTTLTLALVASGFAYGGDDIIFVGADGLAEGVPFAAATKEGAWPLLERAVPGLMGLPVCRRTDAKLVRYVVPKAIDTGGPRRIDAVLLLARAPTPSPRLEPIEPIESLCVLIDSSFSSRGRLDSATLAAFAASISGAACYRFTYMDLDSAASAVKALAGA